MPEERSLWKSIRKRRNTWIDHILRHDDYSRIIYRRVRGL